LLIISVPSPFTITFGTFFILFCVPLSANVLKFRKQKKKYQSYRRQLKEGQNSNYVYNEIWGKHVVPDSIQKKEYLELFHVGRKVKGFFSVTKQTGKRSYEGREVFYIGIVLKRNSEVITIKIIERQDIMEGFSYYENNNTQYVDIGDTVDVEPCSLYLMPEVVK